MSTYAALAWITRHDGAVLCVWNRRYKLWGLPGGKVEEGETYLGALRRELEEETGAVFALWADETFKFYTMPTYSGSGRICHVYDVCHIEDGELDFFQSTEVDAGIGWMSREFLCSQTTLGVGEQFKGIFAAKDEYDRQSTDNAISDAIESARVRLEGRL